MHDSMAKTMRLVLAGLPAAIAGTAVAQDAGGGDAAVFLETAIQGNIAEVQVGTLAEERSAGEVEEFADTLIADHSKALDSSTSIAEHLNMAIPEQPSAKAQAEYAELLEHSGEGFEKEFVDKMVKNHEATIEKYRSFLENAEPGTPAAEYAEQTLPVLEKHLATAKRLQQQDSAAQAARE